MHTIGNVWLYLAFFGLVAVMLLIDFLGFRQKQDQEVKLKTAAYWSIAWVSVATLFGAGLWLYLQQTAGITLANSKVMEYFAGYLLEKSLAIDNVFVWLMIFAAFAIPPNLQRKILLYGVLGAIVLRTLFIFIGAWFVQEFSWVLYIFGAFLLYTGFKFLQGQEQQPNIEEMALLKWLRKHIRITPQLDGHKFFVRQNGLLWATPLFLVLVLVVTSPEITVSTRPRPVLAMAVKVPGPSVALIFGLLRRLMLPVRPVSRLSHWATSGRALLFTAGPVPRLV